MKTKYIIYILALSILGGISACKKDNVNISTIPFLGGDSSKGQAAIDKWVKDSLTDPYNVQVKYKFDEFESGKPNADLIPMKEDIVIPALSDVKRVWIKTYEAIAGSTFIKTYVTKVINMVGSPAYNTNGSITLGEAEGGLKINLFDMNRYDPINNYALFVQKMHTIHHEFGHILQQNKYYTPEYQKISQGFYNGNWTLLSDEDAHAQGFATPYSSSAPDEDFVEVIATMLVEGKDYWENLKAHETIIGHPEATEMLSEKEQIIVAYYKDKWNIDFYALQEAVRLAMTQIVAPPVPAIGSWLGSQYYFRSIKMDSTMLKNNVSGNINDSLVKTFAITSLNNYRLDSITFAFTSPDTLLMRTKLGPKATPSTYYISDYRYKITYSANGNISVGPVIINTLRDAPYGSNANALKVIFDPVSNYLNKFPGTIYWFPSPPVYPTVDNPPMVKIIATSNADSYFWGLLSQSLN
ncbi:MULTISPECIES: substrate import-associated zinc metallohydrolase lipoprotein [Chitinophagaceae]